MKNTAFKSIYFKILLLISLPVFVAGSETSKKENPNILFILVDDLGWADLGYTGSKYHETPNVDKLASEGMVFTNAYAASPICSPSRAAILSGKYPARLNLTDFIPGRGPQKHQKLLPAPFKKQLDLKEFTIAEAMKDAGYKTMFAGKWHLGEHEKYYPQYQGFDINKGGNNTGHPRAGYFSPYKNPQLNDGYEGEYLTDRLTDEVIRFMEQNREKPFFAYLSFYTVHLPMQGKPEKVKKYQDKLFRLNYYEEEFTKEGKTWYKKRQNMPHYAAMVESMDENIGRILESLDNNGIANNTIVIVTSDNGGMATSSLTGNIPTCNAPLRAGKGYLYEGGIREPLIIRWPGSVKAGSKCNVPVTGTDFYPTILDLVGIELLPEQHRDGISLKPLLQGKRIKERPIFWHFPHYSGGLGGRPSGAVRYGNYKLIEFYEDMHVELYDLKNDIKEKNDLAGKKSTKTEELKTLLHQWRKEVNAHMPLPNPNYREENE